MLGQVKLINFKNNSLSTTTLCDCNNALLKGPTEIKIQNLLRPVCYLTIVFIDFRIISLFAFYSKHIENNNKN